MRRCIAFCSAENRLRSGFADACITSPFTAPSAVLSISSLWRSAKAELNRNGPNDFDRRMTTVSGSGVSISLMALRGGYELRAILRADLEQRELDVFGRHRLAIVPARDGKMEGVGETVG